MPARTKPASALRSARSPTYSFATGTLVPPHTTSSVLQHKRSKAHSTTGQMLPHLAELGVARLLTGLATQRAPAMPRAVEQAPRCDDTRCNLSHLGA